LLQRLDELDHDNDSLRSRVAELEDGRDDLLQQISQLTRDKDQLMQQITDNNVSDSLCLSVDGYKYVGHNLISNALLSTNVVALHQARLVLGWVTVS